MGLKYLTKDVLAGFDKYQVYVCFIALNVYCSCISNCDYVVLLLFTSRRSPLPCPSLVI